MIMKMLQQLLKWDLYFIKNGNAPPPQFPGTVDIFAGGCVKLRDSAPHRSKAE